MILSPSIKKAISFAAEKHDGQYRKGGHVPYIAHPVQVALIVSKYTNDEEIIMAAFLHDVLEDCPDVSLSLLQKEFGDRTAQLVDEVSFIKDKKNQTWKERKKAYLTKIKNISNEALLIVAVDKMVNMQAYFEALKQKGKKIECDFGGTPDEYHWFYTEIKNILAYKLDDHPVVESYNKIWKLYKN